MMKKAVFSLLLVLFSLNIFATHNMAGEISYTYVSGLTYSFSIKTYTNTAGTAADRCELIIYFGDGDSAIAPRANGPSASCPSATDGVPISACVPNIKYNVYQVMHSYPASGLYTITVTDPNRSAGIMNIINSLNTPFYLEAMLAADSLAGANSSPSFSAIPLVCSPAYAPYSYNPMAVDPDGDSLYYENFLRGTAGYSDPQTSTAFYIDTLTGNVVWNIPTTIGPYVYDIKISEWRNIGGTFQNIGYATQEVWTNITSGSAGIGDNAEKDAAVLVYPNPSGGSVYLDPLTVIVGADYILRIRNSVGQIVKLIEFKGGQDNVLTIESLSPGMFFYDLTGPPQTRTSGKFVVF